MADQKKRTGRADREDSETNQAWKKGQRPQRKRKLVALSSSTEYWATLKARSLGLWLTGLGRSTGQNTNGDSGAAAIT